MKSQLKIRFGAGKNFLTNVEREGIFLAFFTALVGIDLWYRIELACAIYLGDIKARAWMKIAMGDVANDFLRSLIGDWEFIAVLALIYLLVKLRLRAWLPWLAAAKWFLIAEAIFVLAILLAIALIMQTHFELLAQLQIGLTPELLQMVTRMSSPEDFFEMMRLPDVLFLASVPAFFFLALALSNWTRRIYKPCVVILTVTVFAVQLLPIRDFLEPQTARHPVLYFLDCMMNDKKNAQEDENFYGGRNDLPGHAQMNSIRLIDPAFAVTNEDESTQSSSAVAPDGKRWNILFFVLESTGADYVFDDSSNQPMPMPFLKKICSQGLYLSHHFASANISTRAAFSIFTGLYPPTLRGSTCMEANLVIPTLNRYLGPGYDYFFINPAHPSFYFPRFLLLNNGLRELDTKINLPSGIHPDLTEEARNELDCIDFLQSRIDRAHEPFLAVYWSFIPHYPYSDYGPDYRIRPDMANKRDRYYNNLRTLDDQLRRVWEHLEQTGVASRTLL